MSYLIRIAGLDRHIMTPLEPSEDLLRNASLQLGNGTAAETVLLNLFTALLGDGAAAMVHGLPSGHPSDSFFSATPQRFYRVDADKILVRGPRDDYRGTWATTMVVEVIPTSGHDRPWRKGEPTIRALRALQALADAQGEALGYLQPVLARLAGVRA